MARSRKVKNWIFPITASLLLHFCLIAALSAQQVEKSRQEPPKLMLVMRSSQAQAKNGAALASEARPPAAKTTNPQAPKAARKSGPTAKTKLPAKPAENEPPGTADGAPLDQNSGTGEGYTPPENAPASGDGTYASQSGQEAPPPVSVNTLSIAKKVIPDYPSFSRKRGEEGRTVIVVTIKNGSVIKADIRESSGYERLDNSALRAAKQWKFHQEEEIRALLPFIFRLNS